jgi:protein disulfide-isomerase
MKKIALILFVAVWSLSAQSQELTWHTDVKKATDLSIKNKKPLMLFFTGSDWCGWCKKLKKEVFDTPEFSQWARENVILVELDFPRRTAVTPEIAQQNNELQQMFAVRGYPTVWMVNPSKKDNQISFDRLGSTGYVAGGPSSWLSTANQILRK